MNHRHIVFLWVLLAAAFQGRAFGQTQKAPEVKDATLGSTRNVHTCGNLVLASQPDAGDLRAIKERGIQRVITLRTDGEIEWDEASAIKGEGLEFVKVPFRSPDSLTDPVFDKLRELLKDSEETPTLLHCGSANRVGAVWLTYRVLDQGAPLERAVQEAKEIGLRSPALEEKALDYIKRHAGDARQSSSGR